MSRSRPWFFEVAIERRSPSLSVVISVGVGSVGGFVLCCACVSKPPVCTQNTLRADALHDRAGNGAQAPARSRCSDRQPWARRCPPRRRDRASRRVLRASRSRTPDAAGPTGRCEAMRSAPSRARRRRRRVFGLGERVAAHAGDRRHADVRASSVRGVSRLWSTPTADRPARAACRDSGRASRSLRRARIRRRPDVGALEMRAARVRISGALDDCQAPGVEDALSARSAADSGRGRCRRGRCRSGGRSPAGWRGWDGGA